LNVNEEWYRKNVTEENEIGALQVKVGTWEAHSNLELEAFIEFHNRWNLYLIIKSITGIIY